MPKIKIDDFEEFVEEEVTYEKIRSKRPKQHKETTTKKKNHREKKFEI